MAVSVVDLFKIVNINENHAERPAVAFQFVQCGTERDVRELPVADASEAINQRLAFEVGNPVLEGGIERIVAESFLGADDIVVFVMHWFHAHADRHAMTVFVLQEDRRFA
jgi:hypothetical protein